MKKILLILILLLIVAAGAYYFWYINLEEENQELESPELTASVIVSDSVVSPVNAYDNSGVWFALSNGQMMKYNISSKQLSEYPLPNMSGQSINKIYWPRSGSDFISRGLSNENNSNKIFYNYYNFNQKKYYTLPSNVISLDWLSDGLRVVLIWKGGDGKISLVVSNADATGYRVVTELPWEDLVPKASPKGNKALLVRQYPTDQINKIYLFDLDSGQYQEIVSQGKNNGVIWSPDGEKFVYSQIVGNSNALLMYNLATGENLDLNINSSIDKVGFTQDGNYLYASVQGQSGERIIRVALDTLTQETVYTFGNIVNAINLVPIGKKVYFASAIDGKLYSIE